MSSDDAAPDAPKQWPRREAPRGERVIPGPAGPTGDHPCEDCGGTGRVALPEARNPGRNPWRNRLRRGWRKRWTILQLATGDLSQADIARGVGVSQHSVHEFAKEFAAEIAAVEAELEAEFRGLWIADKYNRLAELQDDADEIGDLVATRMASGDPRNGMININAGDEGEGAEVEVEVKTDDTVRWIKLRHAALRYAAEELGQIPNRMQLNVGGKIATYKLDGVDIDQV